jgi:thioredoxin reductase (NADPH)
MEMEHWDLIILGAGPAGLTAGIYGARSGLKTLVIEQKTSGGEAARIPVVENYPGIQGTNGRELVAKMAEQCIRAGANINELETVVELDLKSEKKIIKTSLEGYRAFYTASAVLITSGCHSKEAGVLGENEFRNKGISYCAVCDGAFFKGKNVLVVGDTNRAVISAAYLANLASSVKLSHRGHQLRVDEALQNNLRARKVEILGNTKLREIKGDVKVKSAVLLNNETGRINEIGADGVFILVGEVPNSQFAKESGIAVDERGYIIVDEHQRTNIVGVYAAGDVTTGPVKQIGTAVGGAIIAVTEASGYVKNHTNEKAG